MSSEDPAAGTAPREHREPPPGLSQAPPASGDAKARPLPSGIDHANDLRGYHFQRLSRHRATFSVTIAAAIAAAVTLALVAGPLFAPLGILGAALLALLVVFALADKAAEDDFFKIYAKQRGLMLVGDGRLPPVTPLLRKGDKRRAEQIMRGPLGDGIKGKLAHYTYTDVYHDKNGRHENHYPFTVVVTNLPDTVAHCRELLCNRRFGFKALDRLEDVFRSGERVTLESIELDERFEIFVDSEQDQNWLRQLFSPSFIVWLAEETPEKFAFELVAGVLCCNVPGHKEGAEELDAIRAAGAGVARRLLDECAEGPPPGARA